MQYWDFDLEIAPGSGQDYPVAARSRDGDAHTTMHFPFDDVRLENYLLKLQQAPSPGAHQRRVAAAHEQPVLEFGQILFEALFAGEVGELYQVSLREAERQHMGLRLRLRIRAPHLASLPWEYLYDSHQAEYLCLSRFRPLVRYIDVTHPIDRLTVTPPLRILGMIASPSNLELLDVEGERRRIEDTLRPLQEQGLVELTWLKGRTRRDLQQAMYTGPWHIFHFIGHADFDPQSAEGVIALESAEGRAHLVRASDFRTLLADQKSLRLVVLNACRGASGDSKDLFSSIAAMLVQGGIPAVLAMQADISDPAALEFTRSFYGTLGQGEPVDGAVAEARKAMRGEIAQTLEWGTPVLYMRAPDGTLFDLARAPEGKMKPCPR